MFSTSLVSLAAMLTALGFGSAVVPVVWLSSICATSSCGLPCAWSKFVRMSSNWSRAGFGEKRRPVSSSKEF
ncbi:hypothetical protein SERLADRAFT_375970 [Serpula lacrymans var. lacrymans S7.9]|uniref:Secreted protein n=1 Tax=Serpula lacrymans var. lacrymans (strain S7.9) TaxID=578457 RepID=F8NCZ9_SERL9|nr:uncharacterized protein SERLADRAFT_375970 [Serpula lacrymans var. lacrymans S7.9]EGO30743.1 hypothetical protein SERLADRAFT_375970 [Serpula lacrymans var. lacrymans S7.9]